MVLPAAWTNILAALTISLPAACTMDSIPACCIDDPFAAADHICLLPGPMLYSVDHCTAKTAGNLFFTQKNVFWFIIGMYSTCYGLEI